MDWGKVYSYCERGGDPTFWAEPLNAISNGAFIVAGLFAAWQLARLPIDPRIARMVLAAVHESVLEEVLIIAAALSVQDPRDRPIDKQEAADTAHEKGGSFTKRARTRTTAAKVERAWLTMNRMP